MVCRSVTRHHQVVMILLVAPLVAGCPSISPHANFKQSLYGAIGRSIDNVPVGRWPYKEALIDVTRLPNGHAEYRYDYIYGRTCRYIFEVDPATHLIVGARFEGKDTDCVINP